MAIETLIFISISGAEANKIALSSQNNRGILATRDAQNSSRETFGKAVTLPELPCALPYFNVVHRYIPVKSQLAFPVEAVSAINGILDEALHEITSVHVQNDESIHFFPGLIL